MKGFLFFGLIFLISTSYSQKLIKGVVLDAEKNKPVGSASIFLNNTSIGTKADDNGNFSFTIPNGKYDLIVSSIGYETYNKTINSNDVPDVLTIKLKVKADLLQTVVIEPYEKDGWEKWGKFFLDYFIGTSANAQDCKIKNTDVIHFRNSKKTNELTAEADEPLIIENKALGYTIRYQLENFSYNFNTHYLLYTGYPFFQPMSGSAGKQKRWEKKRNDEYYGSMMHFMRSLYRNKLLEEGFEVRALVKVPNKEKQRVKEMNSSNLHKEKRADGTLVVTTINKDTADYYDHILRQEDYTDVVGKNLLPGDSIAYAVNATTAGLDFKNYLLVIYKNKVAPYEYRQKFPENSSAIMSQIVLINQTPIEIEANGSYYNPSDLMALGYWAWSEKIATMLPFDYVPSKKE